jgi:hypothetical protein
MPLSSERTPHTYQVALLASLAVPTVFVAFGLLSAAFLAAAFVVPVVYLVYLYDVNQWEDQPVPVVTATVLLSAALGALFTLLTVERLMPQLTRPQLVSGHWNARAVLVACVLVPVVGELLRQFGPLLLIRRPAFDDLIDAVTFGVASGAAYATAETIVLNRQLFNGPADLGHNDVVTWWIMLINTGLLKPVLFGSASALALSRFSGIGRGHAGLTPKYLRGLLEAILLVGLFELGLYTSDRVGGQQGVLLALGVGLLLSGYAILRIRWVLHAALLEAALEAAQSSDGAQHASSGEGWCGHCDMPLIEGATFCSVCGTSTRAVPKLRRDFNSDPGAALVEPVQGG